MSLPRHRGWNPVISTICAVLLCIGFICASIWGQSGPRLMTQQLSWLVLLGGILYGERLWKQFHSRHRWAWFMYIVYGIGLGCILLGGLAELTEDGFVFSRFIDFTKLQIGCIGVALAGLIATFVPTVRRWVMSRMQLNPKRVVHGLALQLGYTMVGAFILDHVVLSIPFHSGEMGAASIVQRGTFHLLLLLICLRWWSYQEDVRLLGPRWGIKNVSIPKMVFSMLGGVFLYFFAIAVIPLSILGGDNLRLGQVIDEYPDLVAWLGIVAGSLWLCMTEEFLLRGGLQSRLGVWVAVLLSVCLHVYSPWEGLHRIFDYPNFIRISEWACVSMLIGFIAKESNVWCVIAIRSVMNIVFHSSLILILIPTLAAQPFPIISAVVRSLVYLSLIFGGVGWIYRWCRKRKKSEHPGEVVKK